MAGSGVTGTITTLTGITVANWEYISIGAYSETVQVLDDTHLGSTNFMERVAHELKTIEPIEIGVHWNYEEVFPVVGGAGGNVISITVPKQNSTTAGTISGNGFISSFSMPEMNQERTNGTITIVFDGSNDPAYAASTP